MPVIIGVILIVVLAGGGAAFALSRGGTPTAAGTPTATSTPAATATASTPTGFKLYTDSGGVYSLDVPDSWLSNGTSALATFESQSEAGIGFEIEYLGVPLGSQTGAAADGFFSSFASASSGTVSNRTGPSSVTIGGENWSKYEGDVTASGEKEHVALLVAGHADSTIVIAYLAPKSSFSSADSQYFQVMLQSFTFLK